MSEKLDKRELANEYQKKALDTWSPVNWRAWGSWHGWGSPVGLGLFFIELSAALWILFHLR